MPENEAEGQDKKKRKYKKRELARLASNLSDGDLCNKCRVWAKMLEDNLADFAALDSTFDIAFVNDWRAQVNDMETLRTFEQSEDVQRIYGDELEKKRRAFFDKLTDLNYYISRAFPKGENIREEFGLHKLRTQDARRGVRDVVIAYATLLIIDFYTAELLAGGMPAGFPVEYENALGEFADAEIKHQHSMLETIRHTNLRIKAFNKLYARHRTVLTAAEAVFDGDEIKIDLFR